MRLGRLALEPDEIHSYSERTVPHRKALRAAFVELLLQEQQKKMALAISDIVHEN